MRHTDAFVYFVFLIYVGSLGIAFAMAHSFSVLGFGEMLLVGVALLSGPLLIAFHLVKGSERLVIAAVHIFLAVLFHPEINFKDPLHLDAAEQFELLSTMHGAGRSWWVRADMAYDLARSLKAHALMGFRTSSPFWYWVFPPSFVLALWGVIFFFHFPKEPVSNAERT
jgi:hypothetical protein